MLFNLMLELEMNKSVTGRGNRLFRRSIMSIALLAGLGLGSARAESPGVGETATLEVTFL